MCCSLIKSSVGARIDVSTGNSKKPLTHKVNQLIIGIFPAITTTAMTHTETGRLFSFFFRATEVDSGNKSKEKKNKRKLDHHQTSDDDVILSDVTAQHNQEALVTDDSSVHNEIAVSVGTIFGTALFCSLSPPSNILGKIYKIFPNGPFEILFHNRK